ncbi:hypothetical protein [Aliarcobacter butzleri]|uniref:hypothetical protein n=1 Tax=Aliarcobacter butzleri TaxID=28197 RepID=UPI00126A76AD|nr:hypothetical protein [Aliarcobacter butzleri]
MEELYKKINTIRTALLLVIVLSGVSFVSLFLFFVWELNPSTILNKVYLAKYIISSLVILVLSIFIYDVMKKTKLRKKHFDLIELDEKFSSFKKFLLQNTSNSENLTYGNFRKAYIDFIKNKISSMKERADFYKKLED